MAFTQADLEALEDAIVKGVSSVTMSDGNSIVYPSVYALIKARDAVRAALAKDAADAQDINTLYSLADWSNTE